MLISSEKFYGNLRVSEIEELLVLLPGVRKLHSEMLTAFAENSDQLREILKPPFYWATIYEYPLCKHVEIYMHSLGILEAVSVIAQSGDNAQSKLLAYFQDNLDFDLPEEDYSDERRQLMVVTLVSVYKTLESIQIHGQSINHLVQKVMRGNDKALFQVIQIDRSAVACPCIADRIALAELQQDEAFLRSLKRAFNGPTKKKFASYRELRFLLEVLDEDGTLDTMTIEDQYELFCQELKVYPHQGSDPAKSLHQFIRRWKKDRST